MQVTYVVHILAASWHSCSAMSRSMQRRGQRIVGVSAPEAV
jgi:hypothetical protein